MSDKRSRDGWVSYLRSRVPDLLAAAAIAATMLLLMLSAHGRKAEDRALASVPVSPSPAASKPGAATVHARLKPRPPRLPHFHEPAAVILDATGAPAINPNNGYDGPFPVTMLSRVMELSAETATPAPATSPVATGALPASAVTAAEPGWATADATPATTVHYTAAAPSPRAEPRRVALRKARAARLAHHEPRASEVARRQALIILVVAPQPGLPPDAAPKVRAPVERVAEVAPAVKRRDPKPSELIMRGLRGPV